jgi:hypothetical protein
MNIDPLRGSCCVPRHIRRRACGPHVSKRLTELLFDLILDWCGSATQRVSNSPAPRGCCEIRLFVLHPARCRRSCRCFRAAYNFVALSSCIPCRHPASMSFGVM